MNIKKNDILELDIVDLNNLGCGVGRGEDGIAVFVKGAVTGDRHEGRSTEVVCYLHEARSGDSTATTQ